MSALTAAAAIDSSLWTCGRWDVCRGKIVPYSSGQYYAKYTDKDGNEFPFTAIRETSCTPKNTYEWGPTNYYLSSPLRRIPERCAVIINTNYLAQATCHLPAECEPIYKRTVDKTWYGGETIICLGLSAGKISVRTDGLLANEEGVLDQRWGRIHVAHRGNNPDACDPCDQMSRYYMVDWASGPEIVFVSDLANVPVWDSVARRFTLVAETNIRTPSGDPCPAAVPTNITTERYYDGWMPTIVAGAGPFKEQNWREIPDRPAEHGKIMLGNTITECERDGRKYTTIPLGQYALDPSAAYTCITTRRITSYNLPFSGTLQHLGQAVVGLIKDAAVDIGAGIEWAIKATINIIMALVQELWKDLRLDDFIKWTFNTVVTAVTGIWNHANTLFRLTEVVIVAGLALLKTNSPWITGVLTVLYAMLTGISR